MTERICYRALGMPTLYSDAVPERDVEGRVCVFKIDARKDLVLGWQEASLLIAPSIRNLIEGEILRATGRLDIDPPDTKYISVEQTREIVASLTALLDKKDTTP